MDPKQTYHFSGKQWSRWLNELADDDYVIIDNFITDQLYRDIVLYFDGLLESKQFCKAGIGDAQNHQIRTSVRGDIIYWLDKNRDHDLSEFFDLMDELLVKLRQYCFLSLSDYEFHLALYPAGSHYEKHIDQFRGRSNRIITVLIYLNENWSPKDGGELKIYRPDGHELIIEPVAKRLLLFKSDSVEHEVLVTHAQRKSLTGWLLHQPATLGNLFS